jgi:hypothetical protein
MEYRRNDNINEPDDHENSDYILNVGLAPELAQRALEHASGRENVLKVVRFEKIWNILGQLVQQPCRDDVEFAGHTAHRNVMLGDQNALYALSFYLQTWRVSSDKHIVASWRRIYPKEDRRAHREVRMETFRRSSFTHGTKQNSYGDLSTLEMLFDRYISAEPYGDAIEYMAVS